MNNCSLWILCWNIQGCSSSFKKMTTSIWRGRERRQRMLIQGDHGQPVMPQVTWWNKHSPQPLTGHSWSFECIQELLPLKKETLAFLNLGVGSQVLLESHYLILCPVLSCCVKCWHIFQLGFPAIFPSAECTLNSSVEKGCCQVWLKFVPMFCYW